jgi:hypothetical protein
MNTDKDENTLDEKKNRGLDNIFELRKTISLIAAAIVLLAALLMAVTTDVQQSIEKNAPKSQESGIE